MKVNETAIRSKVLEILDEHIEDNDDLSLTFQEVVEFKKMINNREKNLNDYLSITDSKGNELYKLALLDDLTIHKLTEKYPLMNDSEFDALVYSLKRNWQVEPVLVYRGKIVDGRHRYLALKKLGIPIIKITILPNNFTLEDVMEEVDAKNSQRRHLSKSQKAIIAYKEWKDTPNAKKSTLATKHGIANSSITYAEKIENKLGSDVLDEFLAKGKVDIGGKMYSNLTSIVNFINKKKKEPPKNINIDDKSEIVKDIVDKILLLKAQGDIEGMSTVRNVVLRADQELINDL